MAWDCWSETHKQLFLRYPLILPIASCVPQTEGFETLVSEHKQIRPPHISVNLFWPQGFYSKRVRVLLFRDSPTGGVDLFRDPHRPRLESKRLRLDLLGFEVHLWLSSSDSGNSPGERYSQCGFPGLLSNANDLRRRQRTHSPPCTNSDTERA